MAAAVKKQSSGGWWLRTRVGAEVREMAMGFYDTAVLSEQVIGWLDAYEKKWMHDVSMSPTGWVELFDLKSTIFELSEQVFFLADPQTKRRISAFQPRWMGKSGIRSVEFELEPVFAVKSARSIGKGKSLATKRKIKTESKRSSVEFESESIEIGDGGKSISKQELQFSKDQFMKLLVSTISKSVTKSTRDMSEAEIMVPLSGSFKLGLISSLFDEMWDEIHQLVSTESKVLATCMLTLLADHISALRLISADTEWLCTWVPDFAQKLRHINIDEEIEEEMEDGDKIEESMFASYISCWERTCSRGYCCSFEDPTLLSPMLFTHYRPGHAPSFSGATRTMQIFSIKVTILEGFEWPLEVFGVVAARDAVDYRRNLLFLRTRDDCQFLTEHDSFLHLTGPSRAILSNDTVQIEVQLKVKGTTKSKDRALITRAFSCNGGHGDRFSTRSIDGYFCRIDLCCEHLEQSIQATILGVRVKEGSLSSKNGLQIVCSAVSEKNVEDKERTRHIVLLDQKDGTIPVDEEGYLDLSRQVVAVKLEGRLEVRIKTFPKSGNIGACAFFTPQSSNISEKICVLGECELEITVAWSFLVDDQQSILMMSYTEPCTSSPFSFMNLDEDAGDGTCRR